MLGAGGCWLLGGRRGLGLGRLGLGGGGPCRRLAGGRPRRLGVGGGLGGGRGGRRGLRGALGSCLRRRRGGFGGGDFGRVSLSGRSFGRGRSGGRRRDGRGQGGGRLGGLSVGGRRGERPWLVEELAGRDLVERLLTRGQIEVAEVDPDADADATERGPGFGLTEVDVGLER